MTVMSKSIIDQAKKMTPIIPAYLHADMIAALAMQAELNSRKNINIKELVMQAQNFYNQGMQSNNLDISEKRLLKFHLSQIYQIQLNQQFLLDIPINLKLYLTMKILFLVLNFLEKAAL